MRARDAAEIVMVPVIRPNDSDFSTNIVDKKKRTKKQLTSFILKF
jgi:hypothetical protein